MEAKEALKKIKNEFDENINSHIFLVETNDVELCIEDIKELLIQILAPKDSIIANQIKEETYLELTIVRSEDKIIKNEKIMELQNRLKTKPVLSQYIAYIIAPAEDMNENSANKLLKTIEEPNSNVIGFLVTQNADLLLPTIKSRCEDICLMYETNPQAKEIPEEVLKITNMIVYAIENRDHPTLYKAKLNKDFKENALSIENLLKDYYNMACNLKSSQNLDKQVIEYIRKNNDYKHLIAKAKYMNVLLNRLTKNMNSSLLIEKMFFDLKEVK